MKKILAALVAAVVLVFTPAAHAQQAPSLDAARAQAQGALTQASSLRADLAAARAQASAAADASRRALDEARAAQERLAQRRAALEAERAQLAAERARTEQVRSELAATAVEGARFGDALGDVTEARRLGRRAHYIDVYFIGFTPGGSVVGVLCGRSSSSSREDCIVSDRPLMPGYDHHRIVIGRRIREMFAAYGVRGRGPTQRVNLPQSVRRVIVSREAGVRYE